MKRSEIILWIMVAIALAANIWLPRHMRQKYSWDRDLSQRIAFDLTRPDTLVTVASAGSATPSPSGAGTPPPSGCVHSRFAAAEYGPEGVALPAEREVSDTTVTVRVRYSVTVPAGTFRIRENVRCWLPFPQGARLIEAGVNGKTLPEDKIILSGASSPHGSLYMEAKASRYKSASFHEVYEYSFQPCPSSPCHSERSEESNAEALAIARWIRDSVSNAPMKEYSTIEDIPGLVASGKKGDDGGKALLFISMCKDKGIPVRWRSGLEPVGGKVYLREWAEVRLDGKDWIPVCLSGDEVPNPESILLINNEFGGELFPAKTYPRSDNIDFLRGEVEWEGGNLYFNQWDYDFQIEYL